MERDKKTKTIHFFDCKIGEFHKNWDTFTVECGKSVDRKQVTDDFLDVTCGSCNRLIKVRCNNTIRNRGFL